MRRLACLKPPNPLKPHRKAKYCSAALRYIFGDSGNHSPSPEPEPESGPTPVRQIINILKTTGPEEWTTNIDLHHLLSSTSPSPLLKIARSLGSSQRCLRFLIFLKDNSSSSSSSSASFPNDPSSLSSVFQAVLEKAGQEGSNTPAKLHELFVFAKDENFPLSVSSARILMKCFGRAKMSEECVAVLNELDPDSQKTSLVNLLFDLLLKSGRLDDALNVLDEMLKSEMKDSPNQNTLDIILSTVMSRNWSGRRVSEGEISGIVLKFGENGVFPNTVLLTKLITRFCRNVKCCQAWDLLHEVMRLGGDVETASCNALLSGLGKELDFQRMNQLMMEMKEKGIQPDVVTFGIVINYLCEFHRLDEALEMLERMRSGKEGDEISMEPDVVIYNTLIKGLCKVGRQEEGLKLMENMTLQSGSMPNSVTYNTLIDGFCKVGEIERSLALFDQMNKHGIEPNVITLNTLLGGMCRCGQVGSAMQFFNEMQRKGLQGNTISYTVLITAFCSANNIDKAMKLFEQMLENGSSPDAKVYYSLISGLSQAGRMDDASIVISKMREAGFCLDIICYNTLICGFCRKNKIEKANELFKDMVQAGLKPDRVTYNTLISFCCEKGDFAYAHILMVKMRKNGIVPNVVTYGALIHAYCRLGLLDEASEIFKDMGSASRFPANTVIYNILIDAHCKSGKVEHALSLLEDMKNKGVRPNTVTYNAVLKGLREMNWLERAFHLMDQMTEQACNPDHITMEILTEWLSAVGQTEKLQSFTQGYQISTSEASVSAN